MSVPSTNLQVSVMETTNWQDVQLAITEGPSRESLWLALAHANELSDPHIEFTLKEAGPVYGTLVEKKRKFILNSLTREDGSGHNWLIELVLVNPEEDEPTQWSGYYDSRRRQGFLTLPSNM